MKHASSSIYSGISFPPRKAGTAGFFQTATDLDLLKEHIYIILSTRKGEMPMMPDFGSSVQDYLFELSNPQLSGILCKQIKDDLERWEPRISVESVAASSNEEIKVFTIVATERATGTTFTTEIPF